VGTTVYLENESVPMASNVIVYPEFATILPGGSATIHVTGQLGYSGVVTIYIGIVG
jgi:hypothetical protein